MPATLEAPPDEGGDDRDPAVAEERRRQLEDAFVVDYPDLDDEALHKLLDEFTPKEPKSEELAPKDILLGDQAPNRQRYRQEALGIYTGRMSVRALMPANPTRLPDGSTLYGFSQRYDRKVKTLGQAAGVVSGLLLPRR
jgi:hypothetical protein